MGNPHRSSEMSGLRFPSLAEVFEACALLEAAYQHGAEHVVSLLILFLSGTLKYLRLRFSELPLTLPCPHIAFAPRLKLTATVPVQAGTQRITELFDNVRNRITKPDYQTR